MTNKHKIISKTVKSKRQKIILNNDVGRGGGGGGGEGEGGVRGCFGRKEWEEEDRIKG